MVGKLKIGCSPTSADTSHSVLSASGGRDYASNSYGMQRKDWAALGRPRSYSETPLPDEALAKHQTNLLGFDTRYSRVHDQLRLLLNVGQLATWNKQYHGASW